MREFRTIMSFGVKAALLFIMLSNLSYACASSPHGATTMTKEKAVELAKAKAKEMAYSIEDHKITSEETSETWKISFFPSNQDSLGGGLVVTIDKTTGKILSAKRQQ